MAKYEKKWKAQFQDLLLYKKEHGHCDIPNTYPQNPTLCNWMKTQRALYKKRALQEKRIQRLEKIGFVLSPFKTLWEKRYSELCAFKKEHGHGNVPVNYSPYPKLYAWMIKQRSSFYKKSLQQGRIKMLSEIGFRWERLDFDSKWNKMYTALCDFKKEHGHCNVPRYDPQHPGLGRWINTQRTYHRLKTLKKERVALLKQIEFSWKTK